MDAGRGEKGRREADRGDDGEKGGSVIIARGGILKVLIGAVRCQPFGVECPGCKERVSGRTEGETSERFKEHMAAEHGDEPYMTRLMERLRSKL